MQTGGFMRNLLIFILLVGALATSQAYANTGVAIVHGTGNPSDAYNDYWGSKFVESVRQGLTNSSNLIVVNCNFDNCSRKR